MYNTTSICQLMPFNTTKSFKIPVYSIVLAAGLPLNCLALWALIYQMKKSVTISVYITNLVLADLLQILTLPFWMYYSYQGHYWGVGKELCAMAGLAFRTNFYAKNYFLCLVAMERYMGLIHPLRFHRVQTIRGATKVSVATWLLVTTLCATGIGLQMKNPQVRHNYCLDSSVLNYNYALFKLSIVGFSFFIPCLLMGFFYFRVLYELRKVVSLEKRAKRQIYGFITLIIATFFLLFTPYQVTSFYRFYSEVMLKHDHRRLCESVRNIFIYKHVTLCLSTLDNILDPLLYILLLKDIRAELKDTLSFRAHGTGISNKSEEQDISPYVTTEQM
ncbi:G-protein coupled receptor 4-like [Sceloporus undulatus]|uniref:G-protein coupled receptor 4-like n=1 Tax=Sceloporus undulatus TaxID=8520 RepID=UPI001C4B2168|nr:G-protein coupled receptor 4-like [Sceloporus undulatus]